MFLFFTLVISSVPHVYQQFMSLHHVKCDFDYVSISQNNINYAGFSLVLFGEVFFFNSLKIKKHVS